MSPSVKLVGIGEILVKTKSRSGRPVILHGIPGIVAQESELGFSGLLNDLRWFAEKFPSVLHPTTEESEPGVSQIYLTDPDAFLEHVLNNPHLWDSRGFGWGAALAMLSQDFELTDHLKWWFIIEN